MSLHFFDRVEPIIVVSGEQSTNEQHLISQQELFFHLVLSGTVASRNHTSAHLMPDITQSDIIDVIGTPGATLWVTFWTEGWIVYPQGNV